MNFLPLFKLFPFRSKMDRLCIKVVLVGDSFVGKTALLERYIRNQFHTGQYRATIGSDFLTKDLVIDGKPITLQLWDTAGQERFRSLGSAFYRGADGCIIVYDITVKQTFDHIGQWRADFITHGAPKDPSSFPFAVVGNKCDLDEHAISEDEINKLTNNSAFNMSHFQVSAKDCTNVERAFQNIMERVARLYLQSNPSSIDEQYIAQNVSLDTFGSKESKSSKDKCCG